MPEPEHFSSISSNVEANPKQARGRKRIIVCCDGTWQDGMTEKSTKSYTNITRIARAVNPYDTRSDPPIPQIVFYQSGIGSVKSWYSEDVVGVLGSTLGAKIEEAYGFICLNYNLGDEIILFGFSRGAYTARMVAMFIGILGVLNRTELDAFSTIFVAYQKYRNTNEKHKMEEQEKILRPYTQPTSPGRVRCGIDKGGFPVKCVGVFETVGELGLPLEINLFDFIKPPAAVHNILGFPDDVLGDYVERAYQALGINEDRKDFVPVKFRQTPEGRAKGQVLQQCWFTGIHDDIGGGYEIHDLSDITLSWMMSKVSDVLSFNEDYILSILSASKPWGLAPPHKLTGIWREEFKQQREVPTQTDDVTCESVHASVFANKKSLDDHDNKVNVKLREDLVSERNEVVSPLMAFEEKVKKVWEDNVALTDFGLNREGAINN